MVYHYYECAAAWVDVDPRIARYVVDDIAAYLDTTHATHGLPACSEMIWPDVVRVTNGKARVLDGWRNNRGVLRYLSAKEYDLGDDRDVK
jgi:hypothetical protein